MNSLLERTIRNGREATYSSVSRISSGAPWAIAGNSVAMYWWKALPNFGDALSPLVVGGTTGYHPRWVSKKYSGKMLAVGSVISAARPNDVIVGAGLIRDEPFLLPPGVKVLAVRGPLTAALLGLEARLQVFGDPGLLAPEILGITRDNGAETISLVPHQVDFAATRRILEKSRLNLNVALVSVEAAPMAVVESIAKSRVCVSTSLHGLVIAEALGIPAIWATMHGPLAGGTFKFRDYYLGTGRTLETPLEMAEALEIAKHGDWPEYQPDASHLKDAFRRLANLTSFPEEDLDPPRL